MWICATTRRNRNKTDSWSVHDTEAEALDALKTAEAEAIKLDGDALHCWAVAPIRTGSEPHYATPPAPLDPMLELVGTLADLLRPGSVNGAVIEAGRDLLARLGHDVRDTATGAPVPTPFAKLRQAVDSWPQFDGDDEVNGGDMVEWFGQWRAEVKALID